MIHSYNVFLYIYYSEYSLIDIPTSSEQISFIKHKILLGMINAILRTALVSSNRFLLVRKSIKHTVMTVEIREIKIWNGISLIFCMSVAK